MCQYIFLSVLNNIVEYTTNQILEVKTLDLIDNDWWPIISIDTMIFFFKEGFNT